MHVCDVTCQPTLDATSLRRSRRHRQQLQLLELFFKESELLTDSITNTKIVAAATSEVRKRSRENLRRSE
jgi:hypothetical protein